MPDAPLTYTIEPGSAPGTTIIALSGPFTLSNLFAFQHELRATQAPLLILDLSGVPYMDSAGLGVLMNAYVSAEHAHRAFRLAGVSERLLALLQMTRVDQVLSIHPSVQAAEASA